MSNDSNVVRAQLEEAYREYREACYGPLELPPTQAKEIRQAFFSGVHWSNAKTLDREVRTKVLRDMLIESNGANIKTPSA